MLLFEVDVDDVVVVLREATEKNIVLILYSLLVIIDYSIFFSSLKIQDCLGI